MRVALDQLLLGEHAFLLELRMKALYNGNLKQYQATTAAMAQNTTTLTGAITGIDGPKAGAKFESLWDQHRYFFNYVDAVKAENSAQATLIRDKNVFAKFMSSADPKLSDHTVSTVLQDHINHIITLSKLSC